jgi:uncharacterized protein (DUF2267 family)
MGFAGYCSAYASGDGDRDAMSRAARCLLFRHGDESMNASDLYARVTARLPETLDVDAQTVTHEVLAALAERLRPDEAAELGAELPDELGDILAAADGEGELQRDEFIENLASRLDLDDDDAEGAASAVLVTIREYLEPVVAMDQVLESLPPDLAQLMG